MTYQLTWSWPLAWEQTNLLHDIAPNYMILPRSNFSQLAPRSFVPDVRTSNMTHIEARVASRRLLCHVCFYIPGRSEKRQGFKHVPTCKSLDWKAPEICANTTTVKLRPTAISISNHYSRGKANEWDGKHRRYVLNFDRQGQAILKKGIAKRHLLK